MMSSLQYQPLDKTKNEIRLLKVQPTKSADEEILCFLEHAIIQDGLEYHALSYTWGTTERHASIQVNGHTVTVTDNLHSALHTFRRCDTVLSIWIDAICINQGDIAEKSHQITLMRDIYHLASEVTIWLGKGEDVDGDDNNDSAFDALDQTCRWEPDDHWYFGVLSLAKVLDRSWWKRVWTMQEVVVARNAVVYCGSRSTPWDSFVKLRHVLRDRAFTNAARVAFNDVRNEVLQYLQKSDFIYATDMSESYRKGDHIPLGDLLLASASRQASEPRDHVYGLLGLASDATTIVPDYSKSVESIFCEALNMVANSYPSYLDFLQHGELLNHTAGKPSWYIDYSAGRKDSKIGAFLQGCATGDLVATKFSDDNRRLTVAGWQIGRIDYESRYLRAGPAAERDLSATRPPPVLYEWLEKVKSSDLCIDRYGDLSSVLAGFYLSLIAGTDLSQGSVAYTGLGRTPKTSWHYVTATVKESADAWFAATEVFSRRDEYEDDEVWQELYKENYKKSKLFRRCALQHLRERAFMITNAGFFGIAPTQVREGDVVALILGSGTPICLRPQESNANEYEWLGAAWVPGIMMGELYEAQMTSGAKVEILDII